jgi:hypothetical protein
LLLSTNIAKVYNCEKRGEVHHMSDLSNEGRGFDKQKK